MVQNQILLQGITPEQLTEKFLKGVDERIRELVNEPEKPREYLTRKEVAERLCITLPTVHSWINKGILNPYRIGNRVLFKSDELDKSLVAINQ